MTFRNKSILIACSDKKDRLQFFNYFDDLAAEKIFTATDYAQMQEMLSQEEESFDVLAFEISPQWVKNIDVIKQIKDNFIDLKLVGLVTKKINMTPVQHSEIGKYVDQLFFSPVTQQELLAKGTALQPSQLPLESSLAKELDNYLSLYFQLTSLPKVLIDVVTGHVVAINDSFVDQFNVKLLQLDQQNWHQIFVPRLEDNPTTLESKLNEVGHYSFECEIKLSEISTPIRVNLFAVTFDEKSYYLAEINNQSNQYFHSKLLEYLRLVGSINFDSRSKKNDLFGMIQSLGLEFCFIVNTNVTNKKQTVVWDSSLNNYAEYYVSSNHAFIVDKVSKDKKLTIRSGANKVVPGDEFLKFYGISAFMAFDCSIESINQSVLVVGGLNAATKWESIKQLFSQLALHYKQSMAFKALQYSHESESQYDVLTELLNRRYIVKSIEAAIESGLQSHEPMAVLFLDLDRFKVINDSLGHDVGDDVLVNIAKILQNNVQSYGVAARYAGDEFLVLLNNDISKNQVNKIAQAILSDVAFPIKLKDGSELKLTVSIGIAYFPEHGANVDKLIKAADIALYNAKLNGKNRYTIYDSSLSGDQAKQSEEMVRNLQNAIESDQIEVYYQPKINAITEDIIGFEALVRWEHPELGIISPGLFIPLAEQSDLIFDIGLLVIEKACKCLTHWQKTFQIPLTMSVNLSPIQLSDKDLTEKISLIIEKTGVYPKHLDFEITESEKFKSVKDALLMFKKIVNLGCTLSIDDFGTGHSTLDYLRKIPAKTLKIDQVFVKNIGLSPDDEAILDATIDMAKRVGHLIVAEGVETEEQRQYLTNKGCDYFQGFLFCRPLPAQKIELILQQRAEILKNH